MEDITHWIIERVAKMPREHKFALGDKLVEACLEVTCALVEATYTRDKLGLLAKASRTLLRAPPLARLASRSKLQSHEQLAYFEREMVEVGRMLGGLDAQHASAIGRTCGLAFSGPARTNGAPPTG